MSVRDVIIRYADVVNTKKFLKHQKEFVKRLQKGIEDGYSIKERPYEPKMVSIIQKIINELGSFETKGDSFRIKTWSAFIHGSRSFVEFEYFGKKVTRELGDLLLIISVIFNDQKYFEKITITQVKRSESDMRWNLRNKEQLYLLSHFPPFRGKRNDSIIPPREIILPNLSGCLGTYGLLYPKTGFSLISAVYLDLILGNRDSLTKHHLYNCCSLSCCFPSGISPDTTD